jgi:hypothetical protein
MALIFGITSNTFPTSYTGTVVNRFNSDYNYTETKKEYLGNPPAVVDTRMTASKKTRAMDVTAGFTAKPLEDAVLALLGTDVTVLITSLDTVSETITGKLMKAVHSGEKDGWWEVALHIEKDPA